MLQISMLQISMYSKMQIQKEVWNFCKKFGIF